MRSLWKGLTPFATHLTLKYALRMGTNATYQAALRDEVRPVGSKRDVLMHNVSLHLRLNPGRCCRMAS